MEIQVFFDIYFSQNLIYMYNIYNICKLAWVTGAMHTPNTNKTHCVHYYCLVITTIVSSVLNRLC